MTAKIAAIGAAFATLLFGPPAGVAQQQAPLTPEQSAAAGRAAAAKTKVKIPAKKIGLLYLYKSNEIVNQTGRMVADGAQALGWSPVECDGKGNPITIVACAETLLVQNVDVLFALSIEPAIIRKQLDEARRRDIKTANVLLAVSAPEAYDLALALDDRPLGVLLNRYLGEQLKGVGGKRTIALQTFPQFVSGQQREEALRAGLQPLDLQVVNVHRTDAARIAEDTRRATEAALAANPDLNVIWTAVNFGFPHAAQVVQSRFSGKPFPARPLVVGFVDDPLNLDTLRKGWGDAVATHTYRALGWVALDQLAQHFGRSKPFDRNILDKVQDTYGIKLVDTSLIAKDNVPAPPADRWPEPVDYTAFFKAKWAAEFER